MRRSDTPLRPWCLEFVGTAARRWALLGCVAIVVTGPTVRAQVLVDTLTAAAAQQQLQAGNAAAVAGAAAPPNGLPANGPPPASAGGVGLGGVKYLPAYVVVLMLVAASTFVVCRPGRRYDAA